MDMKIQHENGLFHVFSKLVSLQNFDLKLELLALIRKRRLMLRSHFVQRDENKKGSYGKFSSKLSKSITLAKKTTFCSIVKNQKP